MHERRLAGAGWADDRDEVAPVDTQAHPAQGAHRHPVELVLTGRVDHLDNGLPRRVGRRHLSPPRRLRPRRPVRTPVRSGGHFSFSPALTLSVPVTTTR